MAVLTVVIAVNVTVSLFGLRALRREGGRPAFDTAPSYGYGQSERIIGALVRTRRSALSLTTKFGIEPPRLLRRGLLNGLGRRLVGHLPRLRAYLSRHAQAATTGGAFSPEDARRSLEESLRALNTSYIDLFLLHEPTASDALREDLIAFLHDQTTAGTIRAFGCGGNFASIRMIAEHRA